MDKDQMDDFFSELLGKKKPDYLPTGIKELDDAIAKCVELNNQIQKLGKK